MPRPRRNFIPGRCYYVWQVGNKLYPLYLDPEDHEHALHLLRRCALRYGVLVHAHMYEEHQGAWLMEPSTPSSISQLMRDMQSQYSRYLNRKYGHRPYRGSDGRAAGRKLVRTSTNFTPRFCAREVQPGEALGPKDQARALRTSLRLLKDKRQPFTAILRQPTVRVTSADLRQPSTFVLIRPPPALERDWKDDGYWKFSINIRSVSR